MQFNEVYCESQIIHVDIAEQIIILNMKKKLLKKSTHFKIKLQLINVCTKQYNMF